MIFESEYLGGVKSFDMVSTFEKMNVQGHNNYAYKCISAGSYIDLEQVVIDYPEIISASPQNPFEIIKGIFIVGYEQISDSTIFRFNIHAKNVTIDIPTGEISRDTEYSNTNFSVSFLTEHTIYSKWLMLMVSYDSLRVSDEYAITDQPLIKINFPFTNNVISSGNIVSVSVYKNEYGTEQPNPRGLLVQSTDDIYSWYGFLGEGITAMDLNNAIFDIQGMQAEDNQEGDHSGEGGGGGNYDDETSEEVPHDGVPSISAVSSGFIKLYHPSVSNLLSFRDYLYSDSFIDNVKKLISNPLDYVISLMLNATIPTDGQSENIGAGGLSSSVSAPVVASQYKVFNCGSVNIEECYGGFLDYDNLTQVRLYLPFCGEITIDTNIVMHSTLYLRYAVDYLTGNCMARIAVYNNHGTSAEFYFKEGNCACQIPMSGANYASFFTQGFRALMGVGSAIGGNVGGGLAQTADAVASMHVERQRVGSISGEHGMLGNYTPYVVIERPAQSFPSGNNSLLGRPSNIGGKVNSFSGYTEIEYIKLDGIKATDAELEEIKQLLADGVYI